MDGYASTGAAMILCGMKETVAAGVPLAIVADTEVLCRAPMDMICAGYGDIIGKYSALNDWRLSEVVFGEYLCPYIYDTTYAMIEQTRAIADGLVRRDPDSVGTLMEALIVVGIMMSFAGSSRPASGSEHHLSHFFEITGIVHGRPYLPHGIDVAYSTIVTAKIRERLLSSDWPDHAYEMPREQYPDAMNEIYGSVGPSCVALQDKLGRYSEDRLSRYRARKDEIRTVLAQMPRAAEIEQMLLPASLHIEEFYATYGKQAIRNAVRYAKDLKDRYTVLWLNYDLNGGIWDE
jgi:glycerol-1-phosphate dehydrogenase [NAD(P)+]